jgi:hypothetical protein
MQQQKQHNSVIDSAQLPTTKTNVPYLTQQNIGHGTWEFKVEQCGSGRSAKLGEERQKIRLCM